MITRITIIQILLNYTIRISIQLELVQLSTTRFLQIQTIGILKE
jgi:hypothetical protein